MANTLDDFRTAETIFIDANVFLHHAFANPLNIAPVERFLGRVEYGEINAPPSVLVINEVAFKIVLHAAASQMARPTAWNMRQMLRDNTAFRTQVYLPTQQYIAYIQALTATGLTVSNSQYDPIFWV